VRPGLPAQHASGQVDIGRGVTARGCGIDARQPQLRGVDVVAANLAVEQLDDGRGRRCSQFVEPVVAVHDHRPRRAVGLQHADQLFGHRPVGHADDLPAHAGWVGQRAQEVEDGADAKLAAHGPRMSHARVEAGRQAEPDPRLRHATGHAVGPEVDGRAERLEEIGRPTRRRRTAVAVLAHLDAGAGDDERRGGRHVERGLLAMGTAPGPARVDGVAVDGERHGGIE